MKIQTAELAISAAREDQFLRDGRPEIAFVGRSNVGKSSLMNRLLGRRKLARTSSTPGRTRLVNYFLINEQLYFVDLPGYGFAKASRADREAWARLMDRYFRGAAHRRVLLILLVDAKVGATTLDLQAAEYFLSLGLVPQVVATKIDKVRSSRRARSLRSIREQLALPAEPPGSLVAVSAVTGAGMPQLWNRITDFLDPPRSAVSAVEERLAKDEPGAASRRPSEPSSAESPGP
ncbi:MAG: ribosome biogenesis GTP-binding protein YihA/YsxC [Holophagales bacterium]|nr:ribosome biogenesis GTP-binding protein YihA/YsxC [Holophagales bacterium]